MRIIEDKLAGDQVIALLNEQMMGMAHETPAGSVHALDIDGLRGPDVTFWTAWEGDDLLGCGAVKELSATHGEIKSMQTATAHRGKGDGTAMLQHIIEEARRREYSRLSLETGHRTTFAPALSLYAKFGFEYCAPFGLYVTDSFCRFMTLELRA